MARKDSNAAPAKKASKTHSVDSPPSPNTSVASMHTHLEDILNRHAAHLLEDYSIRDLGWCFCHVIIMLFGLSLIWKFRSALKHFMQQWSYLESASHFRLI